MGPEVRLPAWLQGYACERSLACCRAPWRAYLEEGEADGIDAGLRASAAPASLLGRWGDSLVVRGGMAMVAQRDTHCAMLQVAEPSCALQVHGGLTALPRACRDFPRSVVVTPVGWEVAFTLACPTACRLVLESRGPYRLIGQTNPEWPYVPRRELPDLVPLTARRGGRWGEVETLRTDWWQRLAEAADQDGEGVAVMRCLRSAPLRPTAARSGRALPDAPGLSVEDIRTLYGALVSIPGRRAHYQEVRRALWARLSEPRSGAEIESAVASRRSDVLRLLAVWIQAAGVHDGVTVAAGLLGSYERAVVAVRVSRTLEVTADVSATDAMRDAVLAASHLTETGQGDQSRS